MDVIQVYEQAIKPLSNREKLTIARLIIDEFDTKGADGEAGFDYLKRILPQIERISLTNQDLAGIALEGHLPE